MKLLINGIRFSPFSCNFLLGPNILVSRPTLLSNTLNSCSLNTKDDVSHSYKITSNIYSLAYLNFYSFYRRRENNEQQQTFPEFNRLVNLYKKK
jgi:hypothetical protein